jgi:hypothetical protein
MSDRIPTVVEVHVVGPPGPAGQGLPAGAVTARQWQSALAAQAKLDAVRDVLPADANNAVAIQWSAAGFIRSPPASDPVWTHTKTATGYSDAQMTTLYTLALTQDS